MVDSQAYVSLALNDTYANAALVLGDSIRDTNTNRKLVLLITGNVSEQMRCHLRKIWDNLIDVKTLDGENLTPYLEQPDLVNIFTKLKVWKLTQFTKCVFLDTDTLVLQNVDELFERDELSAAPDIGWPDCFNSGVFVFVPSTETYASLVKHVEENGSFDDSDQGVLNTYFSDWSTNTALHLPYTYNMVSNACYTYSPAVHYFRNNVKIVHFVGSQKPWTHHYDYGQSHIVGQPGQETGSSGNEYTSRWWNRYHKLQDNVPGTQQVSQEDLPVQDHPENISKVSDQQKAWERGDIDFMRKDRFNVIRHYLDNSIGQMRDETREEIKYEDCCELECNEYIDSNIDEGYQYETVEHKSEEVKLVVDDKSGSRFYHFQHSEPLAFIETPCLDDAQESSCEVTEDTSVNDQRTEEVPEFQQEEPDPDAAARLRWEIGNIDVLGEDSFSKIEVYLNSLLRQLEHSVIIGEDSIKESNEVFSPNAFNFAASQSVDNADDSRASGDTSPSLLSVTDSAYSEGMPKKPLMVSKETQTSFLCLSKAIQANLDLEYF